MKTYTNKQILPILTSVWKLKSYWLKRLNFVVLKYNLISGSTVPFNWRLSEQNITIFTGACHLNISHKWLITVPVFRWSSPKRVEVTCAPDPLNPDPVKQSTVALRWRSYDRISFKGEEKMLYFNLPNGNTSAMLGYVLSFFFSS